MSNRSARRGIRGQSLVIFALIGTVLFGITGLAVDGGVSYLAASAVERAASAAALAGLPYVPNDITSAKRVALGAAVRNGVDAGPLATGGPFTSHGATISYPVVHPGNSYEFSVQLSECVKPIFTRLLGFSNCHDVSHTSTAFYLPPLRLGSGLAQLGATTAGEQPYTMQVSGRGVRRDQGDPFTPKLDSSANEGFGWDGVQVNAGPPQDQCSGWTLCIPRYRPAGTDVHSISGTTDPARVTVNGGYNYAVTVPEGAGNGGVEVYNPSYAPDVANSYRETNWFGNAGSRCGGDPAPDSAFFHPDCYSAMQYTLFRVPNSFDHTQDQVVSSLLALPLWQENGVWSRVNVAGFPFFPPALQNGTFPKFHAWQSLTDPALQPCNANSATNGVMLCYRTPPTVSGALPPGEYRVRVDTLDHAGNPATVDDNPSQANKRYAIRACGGGSGCKVDAIGEMAFFTPFSAPIVGTSSFQMPLVDIPAEYAGSPVNIDLFDPGDIYEPGVDNVISIVPPARHNVLGAGGAFVGAGSVQIDDTMTSHCPPTTCPTGTPVAATNRPWGPDVAAVLTRSHLGDNPTATFSESTYRTAYPYNAHWLRFVIDVPSDYGSAADPAGYWSLQYTISCVSRPAQSNCASTDPHAQIGATDALVVSVSSPAIPVHLVP